MSRLRSFRSTLLWGAMFAAGGLLIFFHLSYPWSVRVFPLVFRFGGPPLMWSLGAVFAAAAFLLIRSGLSPLDRLRAALFAVRQGTAPRIDGNYPGEIQPLVNDLNDLLDHNGEMVRRAQSK